MICYFYEFDKEMRRCINLMRGKGCKRIYVRFDGEMWCVRGS